MDAREPTRMNSSDAPNIMVAPNSYGGGVLSSMMIQNSPTMIHRLINIPPASKPMDGSSPMYNDGVPGMRPCVNMGEPLKKKRGRPRKYGGADDSMALSPLSSSSPLGYPNPNDSPMSDLITKRRGRPPGSGKKQQLDALGSAGIAFTPHVITVNAGELKMNDDNGDPTSRVTVDASNVQNVPVPNAQNVTAPSQNAAAATAPISMTVEDGFNEYQSTRKRPKKTSGVWEHFNEVIMKEKNEIKATCKFCKQLLSGGSKNGTSHLRRHLEKCPKKVNKDIKQFLVPSDSITAPSIVSNSLRNYKFDNGELRRCIVLFVVEGNHSFSIVEERGFRRMLSRANPQFNSFSRHTIKRELLNLHASEMERVKEMILNAKGRVCLTTDNWKNEYTREEYICITCHFVDSNWKLQKMILRFRALVPPYDGMHIADELFLCLSQWNIDQKVFTVTTDNASYNDSMLSYLRVRLNARKSLIQNGEFFQVRCCAHILNLIVQAGLEVIKGPLDRIREMIKYIYRSSKRTKRFFDIAQKDFQLQITRKFRLDMPVRWNSTYKMLDNILYYKDALIFSGGSDRILGSYGLSISEWDNVKAIHKFLKVLYEVTCMFSAVKSPTSNLYFKGVWMIEKALVEVANGEHSILSSTVASMRSKFDKYWSEYNEVLSCATLLDPRCKEKFLLYCYGKIYGKDMGAYYVQKVVARLHSLFKEYEDPKLFSAGTSNELNSGGNSACKSVDDHFSDYSSFMSEIFSSNEKSQVNIYLAEPTRELNEELDILEFWNKSSMRYPDLARLACDILTIPVSTVASESAFSIGGKIITSTRSSLKSKTVQAIVCLRDWIKATDEKLIIKEDFGSESDEDEFDDLDED